jgi:hypothetical protein
MKRIMSDHNGAHTIDPKGASTKRVIHVIFEPDAETTKVGVWLHHAVRRDRASVLLWSGRLPLGVGDLRGRAGSQCAIVLCRVLLDSGALEHPGRYATAVGPGAPLGATGGAWTEPPLPGM